MLDLSDQPQMLENRQKVRQIRDAKVVIVHDFASLGWEARGELPDFNSWLHPAIDDLIEF